MPLSPPRWIKRARFDRVRQQKANLNDVMMEETGLSSWTPDASLTLLDLFALGKIDVLEDEKRIGRYFAVLKKDPSFVCEITMDAFEKLAHTDLPEKRRKDLLKKGKHRMGIVQIS